MLAVIALALGLGLSTTMIGIVDAVTHPWAPYAESAQLYTLRWRLPRYGDVRPADAYGAMARYTSSVQAVEPVISTTLPLDAASGYRDVQVSHVRPGFFHLLGVRFWAGQPFVRTDAQGIVVVSHKLWRLLFGNRSFADGATVRLGAIDYQIIGVMPEGASHPNGADAWLPLTPELEDTGPLRAIVRFRSGVSYEEAAGRAVDMAASLTALNQTQASATGVAFARLEPLLNAGEPVRTVHLALLAGAIVVLLIACGNLAHLMLARGFARQREFSVRMALGASRTSIVWLMFAECVLITLAGAALGLFVAQWGDAVIANRLPSESSWVGLIRPHLSWRVYGATCLLAAAAMVVFGLIPAVGVALGVNLHESLQDGGGTTAKHRQHYSPLVVLELAIALVLLMCGALLVRSQQRLDDERLAFPTDGLIQSRVVINRCAFDNTLGICRRRVPVPFRATFDALASTIASTPGVRSAALVAGVAPLGLSITGEDVGRDASPVVFMPDYYVVSPTYLATLGLPILEGRDFEPGDVEAPVAIVDSVVAARLYPGGGAVGRMVKPGIAQSSAPWLRIVGVARNPGTLAGPAEARVPYLWVVQPIPVPKVYPFAVRAVVRASVGSVPRVAAEVKHALARFPGVRNAETVDFSAERKSETASRRLLRDVFLAMAITALGLAALGLYGILSYSGYQRRREFAVHAALGASRLQIAGLVVRDASVMLLAGTGIGALIALVATSVVDTLLVGVYRTDVVSLVAVELLLIGMGSIAAIAPVLRAMRADAVATLRAV